MTQEVRSGSNERLYVKKFGGTSVGSIERIEVIAEQIAKAQLSGEHQVLVLSAMAGETNRLFALAGQIDPDASAREMDMLVSTGEQVSIALMAMALAKRGVKAKSLNAARCKSTPIASLAVPVSNELTFSICWNCWPRELSR